MDAQEIKTLLNKYDNGMTTPAEERLLETTLTGNEGEVAEELAPDAAYFEALHRLQMPDERVGQEFVTRLSRHVDQWNAVEKSSGSRARRMSLRVVGMVAASLLLLFSLGMALPLL